MLKKLILSLLVSLSIGVGLIISVYLNINNTIFNPEFYDEKKSSQIQKIIAKNLTEKTMEENENIQKYISPEILYKELKKTIPVSYIQNSIYSLLDQIKNYNSNPSIILDLKEIRNNIPAFIETIAQVSAAEITSNKQEEEIVSAQLSKDLEHAILDYFPNEINLDQNLDKKYFYSLNKFLQYKPQIIAATSALVMFLMLIIGLIIYKPFSLILKWEAKTLILSAFIIAAYGFAIQKIPQNYNFEDENINSLIHTFFSDIGNLQYYYASIIATIGILLAITSIILKRKQS